MPVPVSTIINLKQTVTGLSMTQAKLNFPHKKISELLMRKSVLPVIDSYDLSFLFPCLHKTTRHSDGWLKEILSVFTTQSISCQRS